MPTAPPTGPVRRDIEGLRAVAIGTVLAFHAGLPWFSGGFVGVDIFFVLSGFLITGILAREVSRTGRVRLASFWARRARRLLPASALVLAFSALVAYLWLPVTQRAAFGWDIASAAVYVVNWRLADRSVDYLAEDVGASPVQHFWSLAVEEQFYLVWPLLILAAALVWRRRPVVAATVALSVVTVTSFAYSVQQSVDQPQTAFFVSTTRVWELGVGALLALAAPHLRRRLPDLALAALGWTGVAMILVATFAYDGSTTWPGVPALLPVLGTAAALAAGLRPTPWAPGRLLSWAPLVWIGGLSYSLYLWHWPLLVAGEAVIDDFRIRHGVALTLLAFVPAWLSHRYVENPVRFGARWRPSGAALRLGAGLTAVGILVGAALPVSARLGGALQESAPDQARGAAAIAGNDTVWSDVDRVDAIAPLPEDAPEDLPAIYERDPRCQLPVGGGSSEPLVCRWGPRDAAHTVVVTGDSKINQWQSALEELFRDGDVEILQITKSGCALTDAMTTLDDAPWDDCRDWGTSAVRMIEQIDPDLVITSQRRRAALPPGGRTDDDATAEAMVDGLTSVWGRLEQRGIDVVALLDNPSPTSGPVYECVAANPTRLSRCSFEKQPAIDLSAAGVQREAAAAVPGVDVLDLTDTVCPDADRCAAVIGDVLVYRQGSHVTNTYAVSAAPELGRRLADVAPDLVP